MQSGLEVARRELVVLADKVGKERGRTILWDLAESRGSRFPPSVRDRVICQLVASDRVTLEEIAGAFGITRQRVSQVAAEHGVAVVRRRNFWAQVEEHLEYLATPKGRREANAVMARVARERRFWALKRGGLGRFQTASVAEGLGFPMGGGARLRTRLWWELKVRGIVQERCLVGVVLFYGLGVEDPADYLEKLYHRDRPTRMVDVAALINESARREGVLQVSRESVRYYMKKKEIPFKKGGGRGPSRRGRQRSDIGRAGG